VKSLSAVRRRPSAYRSSFPLEELVLEVEPGEEVRLACKELRWEGLGAEARLAKPRFLHDPRREVAVYASVLGEGEPGPPRYYGSLVDGDRCWLVVEWVEGRELYQVGERGLWEEAAAWLGRNHARLRHDLERHAAAASLVEHDARFYRRWMRRADEFSRAAGPEHSRGQAIEWLRQRHDAVVETLLALPRTVLHGDFYASNVLIRPGPETRVAPVDWELAAKGPGLTDLAALVSGGWSEADRDAIAAAYFAAIGQPLDHSARRDLGIARLQLAIQLLGWAPPKWSPPRAHRHDWLTTAVELVEDLEI
jgi:aminoglycoside phosphotransferase (APT) family kinase protein